MTINNHHIDLRGQAIPHIIIETHTHNKNSTETAHFRWRVSSVIKTSWHFPVYCNTYIDTNFVWLSYLSSCHSAICFPGEASTSFQWRNSSADAWPHRITWPSSFFMACLLSLVSATLTETFFIWFGSTVAVSASLNIGEQLWGFLRVLSRPSILSPPTVIHTLAWASAHREGERERERKRGREGILNIDA